MLAAVDWTNVLDTLITTLPAIIAAVVVVRVHHLIKTPSGDSIGHVVERAHETGIANNGLLGMIVPHTRPADGGELREQSHDPVQVPADDPSPAA